MRFVFTLSIILLLLPAAAIAANDVCKEVPLTHEAYLRAVAEKRFRGTQVEECSGGREINILGLLCGGKANDCEIADTCENTAVIDCGLSGGPAYLFVDKKTGTIMHDCSADKKCESFITKEWKCEWPKKAPVPDPSGLSKECRAAPYDLEWFLTTDLSDHVSDRRAGEIALHASPYRPDVKKNVTTAITLFKKAAVKGDVISEQTLGTFYSWNLDIPESIRVKEYSCHAILGERAAFKSDDREAAKWYQMAAERGDNFSQYRLGNFYRDGKGVPKDFAEAYFWTRLAGRNEDCALQSGSLTHPKTPEELMCADTNSYLTAIEKISRHLTTAEIAALDKKVQKWQAVPSAKTPSSYSFNVSGYLCGKSNFNWQPLKTCGDLAYFEGEVSGDLAFANMRTKRAVSGKEWSRCEPKKPWSETEDMRVNHR